jgi:hypothetical protein
MFRATFLALAATAGLIGTTELGTNEAKANTWVRIIVRGPVHPIYHPPIVVGRPVYNPRPIVIGGPVYNPPTVVVTPVVYPTYSVFYRNYPTQAWSVYGTFNSPVQAAQTVSYLTSQGFMAYESAN